MALASAEKRVLFGQFDDAKFLVVSRKMGHKLTSERREGVAVFFAHCIGVSGRSFYLTYVV